MNSLNIRTRDSFPEPLRQPVKGSKMLVLDLKITNDLMYSNVVNLTEVAIIYIQAYMEHGFSHREAMLSIKAQYFESLNPYILIDDDCLTLQTDASLKWECDVSNYMSIISNELSRYPRSVLLTYAQSPVYVKHLGGNVFGIYGRSVNIGIL